MVEFLYPPYRCPSGEPLRCKVAHPPAHADQWDRHCATCGFPAILNSGEQIRGNRGIYRIGNWLGSRGAGRLYQASEDPDDRPVTIKEYLLPDRCFNPQEAQQRQQAFIRLAGLALADGRSQDFRMILPLEAIADSRERRCYLVTAGNLDATPTLGSQLAILGAMTGQQVRRSLIQLLQTLEFLNQQKFRLPDGQVQRNLCHGNLSLDTLLIALSPLPPAANAWGDDFQIYACDLSLWEFLFAPPNTLLPAPSVLEDLTALGQIAFYLLAGKTHDPSSGKLLDPKNKATFPPVSAPFKEFILRLVGMGVPFASFTAARQALLQLPLEPVRVGSNLRLTVERQEKVGKPTVPWRSLLLLCLFLLAGGLIWWWLASRRPPETAGATDKALCCIQTVTGIPAGTFTYTASDPSLWSYVLRQENLIERGKTLEQVLRDRQPQLLLNFQPEATPEAALEQVKLQRSAFLMTSLTEDLSADFQATTIAYDGLVVFIAFSYARRENSLPSFLQGKITFEQLRRLYTGDVVNWRQLGGPNMPVRLYLPPESEAIRIFERRVLQSERAIAQFRRLQSQSITTLPTFPTLRRVIQDFEQDGIGSISFGSLSQVFGQCSVYPLALVNGNQPPVQSLSQQNGDPVTPDTNLCAAKGSYDRDVSAFQTARYPLSYPLAVVYPRNNRRPPVGQKFAEILQTEESQRLLRRTGLVPLQPLPRSDSP